MTDAFGNAVRFEYSGATVTVRHGSVNADHLFVSDKDTTAEGPAATATLTLGAEGYLAELSGLGRTHSFTYGAAGTGLLTQFLEPADPELGSRPLHLFAYDEFGRLMRALDPNGNLIALTPSSANGSTLVYPNVQVRTGAGAVTNYQRRRDGLGNEVRSTTDPAGLVTTEGPSPTDPQSTVVTLPNGMRVTARRSADERFGLQAPVPVEQSVRFPQLLGTTDTVRSQQTRSFDADHFVTTATRSVNGSRTVTERVYAASTPGTPAPSPSCARPGAECYVMERQVPRGGSQGPLTVRTEVEFRPQDPNFGMLERAQVPLPGGALATMERRYDTRGRLVEVVQLDESGGLLRSLLRQEYDPTSGRLVRLWGMRTPGDTSSPDLEVSAYLGDRPRRLLDPARNETGLEFTPRGQLSRLTELGATAAHAFGYQATGDPASYTPPLAGSGAPTMRTSYDTNGDHQLVSQQMPGWARALFVEYETRGAGITGRVARMDTGAGGQASTATASRTFGYYGAAEHAPGQSAGALSCVQHDDGGQLRFEYNGSLPTAERWYDGAGYAAAACGGERGRSCPTAKVHRPSSERARHSVPARDPARVHCSGGLLDQEFGS